MKKKLIKIVAAPIITLVWRLIHPRTISKLGMTFKIDSWVVPNYITRKKTFLRLNPIFDHYVKSTSTVLDIGASFGYYSLYCSKILQAQEIIAFEPTARAYNLLIDNLKANNIHTVKSYRVALGDKEDKVKLNHNVWGSGNNSIGEKNPWNYEWVDMITADSVAPSSVDFVKIDVEGAEYLIIKGMKNILSASKPPLLLEVSVDKKEIKEFLNSLGYDFVLTVGHNYLALHQKDKNTLPSLLKRYDDFQKENKFFINVKQI